MKGSKACADPINRPRYRPNTWPDTCNMFILGTSELKELQSSLGLYNYGLSSQLVV